MVSLITMMALMIALVVVVPIALWIIDFALLMHDWNDDIKGCEKYGADYIVWKHGWKHYGKHRW